MLPKLLIPVVFISLIAITLIFIPKQKPTPANTTGPIVFLGDSITAGEGAGPGEDFPSIIGKSLNVSVVNAGVSGDKTYDALLRVDKDVIAHRPSIVVVELGGNDLLSRADEEVARKNLDLILTKIRPTRAKIIIVEVKFFVFQQFYETDWAALAKKYDAIYVPDILEGVITDNSLKQDDIHPNAKGYAKIAEKLTPIIAPHVVR